ncbi:PREDICTED: ubiquitin carboxyl-terminal hydrolase 43 [Nicrophorus vespilloides]|uniref:ubiquitinyl hydrolase 1 n=1 Tax=Nicrophorus vespilloides TaxID=110193 RepID=A0ABM1MW21_NICVS|nr:PREDICTED: ubiquitin carboxyl-terminal hydrolase 43 [Nicrophorus vespilloides]
MCAMVTKSSSDGEMKTEVGGQIVAAADQQQQNFEAAPGSRLRRTFTLPRNPLTRISKRKFKKSEPEMIDVEQQQQQQQPNNQNQQQQHAEVGQKKVFRRPSFRKIINRIAQHISVPNVMNGVSDARVPPVGGLQTWAPDDTPGVTGLRNHGNTCFINAVLQCISHTDVLAEYFVLDKYKIDLSRRNKLNSKKHGTKGEVTEQLAVLLKALWACQYSPDLSTGFKLVVERYGAQYKGTQQHDALEFLIWLLDKVHEDLNMAPKKKYKSIKTLGRPDEVIAAETLENYRRRDNSFIHSVFQAQYRSSLSCPTCLTQSNTFDPFQCISVQLPQLHRHSVYVTVLYTSQQPREVRLGLSLPSGANVSELRDLLESDTSISRCDMLLTEIGTGGFLRTFTDQQPVNVITDADPVYCIEVPQLKDAADDDDENENQSAAYVLLCWINVLVENTTANTTITNDDDCIRFGSPYTMQVNRETSYVDLQKLMLKEMAPILHDDILTSAQAQDIFRIRISDPACNANEPASYLEPDLEHPLFMEAVDQALALCGEESGPTHVKLVLEWTPIAKEAVIADDTEDVEEHSSVKQLKTQALQGGAPLTLEECLRHYTKAETLDDAWRCPQCQQYQPVIKTLDMWSLPDILVVHFKRFRQQTLKGRNSTKLLTMVEFPVCSFDMTPHLAKTTTTTTNNGGNINGSDQNHHHNHHNNHQHNNHHHQEQILNGVNWSPWKRTRKQSTTNDNTYDLYAVVYHHGNDLETGHYTAACRNPYDSNWYLYDDAKVVNLTEQSNDIALDLVNNSAYILFYQKRNGVYVNSSSNSSSAASTSSVGSAGDHWVSRMPKFVPPKGKDKKAGKIIETAAVTTTTTPITTTTTTTATTPETKVEIHDAIVTNSTAVEPTTTTLDEVTLRNSQNTLYNSNNSIRKSEPTSQPTEETKKYTTSIYINASGNVDITTSEVAVVSTAVQSPVLSPHRVNGISDDDIQVKLDESSEESRKTRSLHVERQCEKPITDERLSWVN